MPVDLVIVRENTEDLYAGIEFEAGKPATGELIDYHQQDLAAAADQDSGRDETGISIKPISVSGTRADRAAARSSTPAKTAARR